MITSELDTVWITSDGKKFLSKIEAETHEEINNKENITWLERLRLNRKLKNKNLKLATHT